MSQQYLEGLEGCLHWLESNEIHVTFFIVTDLFEHPAFCDWMQRLILRCPNKVTFGCHGHTHRSWSAWPKDEEGFSAMLSRSLPLLKERTESLFRPFFRAPNGYIAPWMAPILAQHDITLDSSINPSWVVKNKSAGGWKQVRRAMQEAQVLEREWATSLSVPINGPALFRWPLSILSRRIWNRASNFIGPDEHHLISDSSIQIRTLYCHILDFGRMNGMWQPPLRC